MAGAVEMCSGLGACRKTLDGTMCPSYMATREEQHSTRGRANVLRLAMAGQLGEAGLGDEGVYETLDLCLECRACKAECPVGVDVARFKSEFLADYWARHGTPLAGPGAGQRPHAGRTGAAGSRRCRTGWPNSAPARGDQRARCSASIARRRCRSFGAGRSPSWPPHGSATAGRSDAALLFNDTFTNHYDPEIGLAALDVLRAAGDRAGARAERLLRPAADFEGAARRGAHAGRARTLERLYADAGGRPAARLLRAELPVGRARGRSRRCCAASARRQAETVAARQRPVRGVHGSRALDRLPLSAGTGDGAAARALPPEVDGAGRAGQGAARRASRERRSSTSTPAAAAWPAPSATRTITTTSRAPSASGSSSRPSAPEAADAVRRRRRHVLPPPGARLHRSAVHPPCSSRCRELHAPSLPRRPPPRQRARSKPRLMLAWLSLAALVDRHDRQLHRRS